MSKPKCQIKDFSIKHFLEFVLEAVKYFPTPEGDPKNVKCKRLNSFVMLEKLDKLTLSNFGQSLFKAGYEKFNLIPKNKTERFPALVANVKRDGRAFNLFSKKRKRSRHAIQLMAVDVMKQECTNCGYCRNRGAFDFHCDTKELIYKVTEYLCQICCAVPFKYNEDGYKVYTSQDFMWISKPTIAQMKADGVIDGAEIDRRMTGKLQKMMEELNVNVQSNDWQDATGKYYGHYIEITIDELLKCTPVEFEVRETKKAMIDICCPG